MNRAGFHIAINQELQREGSYQYDTFLPEELDFNINWAIREFIDKKYKNIYDLRSYEMNQEELDSIRQVIKVNTPLTNITEVSSYVDKFYQADIPNDYRFLINLRVEGLWCNKTIDVKARIISNDEIRDSLRIPFLKPSTMSPIATMDDKNVKIYIGEEIDEVDNIYMDYIKEPVNIEDVPTGEDYPDLAISTHNTIVTFAVRHILGKVENQQRYQVQTNEERYLDN